MNRYYVYDVCYLPYMFNDEYINLSTIEIGMYQVTVTNTTMVIDDGVDIIRGDIKVQNTYTILKRFENNYSIINRERFIISTSNRIKKIDNSIRNKPVGYPVFIKGSEEINEYLNDIYFNKLEKGDSGYYYFYCLSGEEEEKEFIREVGGKKYICRYHIKSRDILNPIINGIRDYVYLGIGYDEEGVDNKGIRGYIVEYYNNEIKKECAITIEGVDINEVYLAFRSYYKSDKSYKIRRIYRNRSCRNKVYTVIRNEK